MQGHLKSSAFFSFVDLLYNENYYFLLRIYRRFTLQKCFKFLSNILANRKATPSFSILIQWRAFPREKV